MTHDEQQVALITGGGGAIAAAIGRRLHADGWLVAFGDLDEERGTGVAKTIPGSLALTLDVTDPASVSSAVAAVLESWGRLDGLVNNAGVLPVGDLEETNVETWDRALAVNLRGAYLVTREALCHLRRSPSSRVVMIGSRAWLSGGNPAYAASKAGLIGLARSVCVDLAGGGGTCNVVAPGPVDTPLAPVGEAAFTSWANQTLLGRNCEPEDVAGAVSFFMGPDASFVTGEVIHVAGGLQLAAQL